MDGKSIRETWETAPSKETLQKESEERKRVGLQVLEQSNKGKRAEKVGATAKTLGFRHTT